MEIMASTSNAENLVKIARIVYQLCDYTDFRVVGGTWHSLGVGGVSDP